MKRVIRAEHDHVFAFPPKLDDWVPADHPVRFVRDLIATLDLAALGFASPKSNQGGPVYDNALLLSVWMFGWMEGVRSSRALEKACYRDVAFLWLTGNRQPESSTLRRFFRQHREALRALFVQCTRVAAQSDLIGFALHALDGTKMAAASSFDSALHRTKLEEKLGQIDQLTDEQLRAMEARELREEPSYRMPPEMAQPEVRRQRLRAVLEAQKKNSMKPLPTTSIPSSPKHA